MTVNEIDECVVRRRRSGWTGTTPRSCRRFATLTEFERRVYVAALVLWAAATAFK